jgi:hypothetical protein
MLPTGSIFRHWVKLAGQAIRNPAQMQPDSRLGCVLFLEYCFQLAVRALKSQTAAAVLYVHVLCGRGIRGCQGVRDRFLSLENVEAERMGSLHPEGLNRCFLCQMESKGPILASSYWLPSIDTCQTICRVCTQGVVQRVVDSK